MVFIAKRLTFSEEALKMIKGFRRAGSFRSTSQTVEEIVRRVYYVKQSPTLTTVNIQLKRLGISVKENERNVGMSSMR